MENYLHSNEREGRIKKLKKILIALGYRIINESGEFDERTRRAVKSYQNDNKIRTTGIVDKYTWDALQKSYALLTERSVENEGITTTMPQATPLTEPVAASMSESVPELQPSFMPEPEPMPIPGLMIEPQLMPEPELMPESEPKPQFVPEPIIQQKPDFAPISKSNSMEKSKFMDGYMPSPVFAEKPEPHMFLSPEPMPAPKSYLKSEMLPQESSVSYLASNPESIPVSAQIPASYPMPEPMRMSRFNPEDDHVCKCGDMPNVVPIPDDYECGCGFAGNLKFGNKNLNQYEMHEYIHNYEPVDMYKYLK